MCRSLGLDPNDPNVKVRVLPLDGLAHGANIEQAIEEAFGDLGDSVERRLGRPRLSAKTERIMEIGFEVVEEVLRASKKHAPMHSPHEAHSVILEEVEELWDEIKADRGRQKSARDEAIQVAAMAIRFILDIDPK